MAAEVFAKTLKSFEDVALMFIDTQDTHALILFLVRGSCRLFLHVRLRACVCVLACVCVCALMYVPMFEPMFSRHAMPALTAL